MELSEEVIQLGILVFIALSVGGLLLGLLYPYFTGSAGAAKRVTAVTDKSKASATAGFRARMQKDKKAGRSKQIQESLNELEQREKARKKKVTAALSNSFGFGGTNGVIIFKEMAS